MTEDFRSLIDEIVEQHRSVRDPVLPILQTVQARLGYLGREYLEYTSERTGVSLSELYGIVTFYNQFRLNPPGRHEIKVCEGTACHVRKGARVLESLKRHLHVRPGETTEDRRFSLETVRCLGCCGLSPVMVVNDETFGRVKPAEVTKILERFQ